MSATTKGALHEREAVSEYESMGFAVFKPKRCSRYGEKDIWNRFDFCAIRGPELHFVQVKTNSTQGFLKVLKQWAQEHPVPGVAWVLMVRQDLRKNKEKWRYYYESLC